MSGHAHWATREPGSPARSIAFFARTVIAVMRKELRQAFRDPRMAAILFVVPVLQLTLLGFAVDLDVDRVRTAVVDLDRTPKSRRLLRRRTADPTLRVVAWPEAPGAPLEDGRVFVVLVVPEGYARYLGRGDPTYVQVLLDGTDPVRSQSALALVQQFLQREGVDRALDQAEAEAQRSGQAREVARITVEPRVFYNPSGESAVYMVPGVAAAVLLVVTTVVTAMSIARERELETIEQLLVTPMRPSALLLGKVLPFAAVGFVSAGLVISVGTNLFDVPIRGSLFALALGTLLYLLCTLGTGVLISTAAKNQQQAILASFFFILPAILLSGFMSPIENMPDWIQVLSRLDLVRYYVQILRAILLKGAGLADLRGPLVALAVFGAGVMTAGSLRFRKRLG